MSNKPLLVFSGPVDTRSGYGDHARDLVLSLIKMDKFDIKIASQRWGNTPRNQLDPANSDHLQIIQRILTGPTDQQPDIWIQLTVPNEFHPVGKYNIGITAGIETTAIPMDWITGCNRMNLIVVPSEHSKKVMVETTYAEQHKQTGELVKTHRIEKPVEVLFEGSDTRIYNNSTDIDADVDTQLSRVKEDFGFLFVGHWLQGDMGADRKDVGMMIKTFLGVFKNRPNPPALILKTSQAGFSILDRKALERKLTAIKNTVDGDLPPIYLLHGDLTPTQMNSMYNHPKVKVMLSFTKGEGYGRPLQEFAFTGKPIIATNWSGHIDFLEGYGLLVGGKVDKVHKSAHNQFIIPESQWFTINYGEAASVMNQVFEKYGAALSDSQGARQSVVTRFSLEGMNKAFTELMDKYVHIQKEIKLQLPKRLPKLQKVSG